MTGTTNAGGAVSVYHDSESESVMVGVKDRVPTNPKRKYTTMLIPLTPKEARIMAKWLNAAANHTESLNVDQRDIDDHMGHNNNVTG